MNTRQIDYMYNVSYTVYCYINVKKEITLLVTVLELYTFQTSLHLTIGLNGSNKGYKV